MADFADSTPLQILTEPDTSRPVLTPPQEFRIRVARYDLERVRDLDLSTTPASKLLLELGALVSSLYSVLGVLEQVTEPRR
jgi:hypothetical protein